MTALPGLVLRLQRPGRLRSAGALCVILLVAGCGDDVQPLGPQWPAFPDLVGTWPMSSDLTSADTGSGCSLGGDFFVQYTQGATTFTAQPNWTLRCGLLNAEPFTEVLAGTVIARGDGVWDITMAVGEFAFQGIVRLCEIGSTIYKWDGSVTGRVVIDEVEEAAVGTWDIDREPLQFCNQG